jgi:hypothetical protein
MFGAVFHHNFSQLVIHIRLNTEGCIFFLAW